MLFVLLCLPHFKNGSRTVFPNPFLMSSNC